MESDTSQTAERRFSAHAGLRWTLIGLAAIALLVVAAYTIFHVFVDASALEKRLTNAIRTPSDSLYRVDIEKVRVSLLHRSLRAEHLTVQPDSQRVQQNTATGKRPLPRYRLTIPALQLDGINLWRLLWNQDLSLERVYLERPHLHIAMGHVSEQDARGGTPEANAASRAVSDHEAYALHAAIARSVPPLHIDSLLIEKGTLSIEGSRSDSIGGISMQFHNVTVDSMAARDTSRVLFSNDIRVQVEPFRRFSADSLYLLKVGALHGTSKGDSLALASIEWTPTLSDEAFMQRHPYRTNRYIFSAGPLALTGIDYWNLIENGAGAAALLRVDSLFVDVYCDRTLPMPPESPPPTLPHEAFQAIDMPIRLDTIRVIQADLRYSERAEDGTRRGTITFEDTWGTIYNVTNDPHRMTPTTPAVLEARSRLAGAGRLDATIRYELLAPSLTMAYRGTLGSMDATAFNQVLVDLEGIRIESGHIDDLWFEVKVNQGVASGALRAIYRNLKIETLNKRSRERNLGHRIETFIANISKIQSDNVAEGDTPPRVVVIHYERKAEEPIFKFMWKSLREGLLSTTGLQ